MSPSSTYYHALKQIAVLLSSDSTFGDPMDLALELARKTVGASAAALIWSAEGSSRMTTWASVRSGNSVSPDAERAALAALDGKDAGATLSGVSIVATPEGDNNRAVIVVEGAKKADDEFLDGAFSLLLIALQTKRAKLAAEESGTRAEKRLAEVATIYEIGRAINEVDLDRLLQMVTAKAALLMDAEACSLMLRDENTDHLVIRASFGLPDDVVHGANIAYGEGIAGRVAATGEPMLLVDVGSDPRFDGSVTARADISSSLCVPLKDEDGVVQGVLSIRRHKPSPPFTEGDLRLFSIFASQSSLAISNAQLYGRLQKQIHEMASVSELLRAINSTLDLDAVLSMISDSIVDVVGFDRCSVYLLDPRTNELIAGVRRGYGETQIPERVRVGEGLVGIAAKEHLPIFEEDRHAGTPSLAAPMIVRGTCIGVVLVDNHTTGNPMLESETSLLSTFVEQAGIAVENARLYEAMEEKYAELNMLYEHSRAIGAAFGLNSAADMLIQTTIKASRADGGVMLLLNERQNSLTAKSCTGSCEPLYEELSAAGDDIESVEFIRSLRGPMIVPCGESNSMDARVLQPLTGGSGILFATPLMTEDVVVGVLVLRKSAGEFDSGEVKLVSILTSHAAPIIKNAISYEHRMERKVLELTALHEFSGRISSAANLEEALDSILAMVSNVVECDESYIYAVDPEHGMLVPKAGRVIDGTPRQLPEVSLDADTVSCWSIREHKAFVFPDIGADKKFSLTVPGPRAVKSLMSIPLMVQDEVVAVLIVYSYRPNLYSEDDVKVLSIIASQGAAIYKELEALSALTSYTDNILSSVAAGVITLDSDGYVLTWNKAAAGITGLESEDVVGIPTEDAVANLDIRDDEKAGLISTVEKVAKTGEVYHGYKVCFHGKEDDTTYLNMSMSPLLNNAGEQLGIVVIFEDVTREMKMDEEFRKVSELAAVGQLAASIAHELRNPLASIKGSAQLLQEQYDDHPMIVEFLGIILEEVDALSKLTTEFLNYARPMQLELKPMDINSVVEKTLALMNVQIDQCGTKLTERLTSDLPTIEADEKQVEQVLRNIIINALQAMPNGGDLEISTSAYKGSGGGIEFSVTDTGSGIPEKKLERIFVPFFTTKTKGTGLGLSVVNKIIDNHGGRIVVTSEEGKGTTFRIILPEHAQTPTQLPPDDAEEQRRSSGTVPHIVQD